MFGSPPQQTNFQLKPCYSIGFHKNLKHMEAERFRLFFVINYRHAWLFIGLYQWCCSSQLLMFEFSFSSKLLSAKASVKIDAAGMRITEQHVLVILEWKVWDSHWNALAVLCKCLFNSTRTEIQCAPEILAPLG